ncbi:hypothetical protein IV203_038557 [Nitzschia inconspicua]|uniref:Uncharacterized protein n=1 Tax=Nitzschia inconspicua TaxID=303405 RepID=A0A9K3Q1Z0_9STRA|nr:hypothetical protein IV203_038557 [Nitzschia inconspicua]
MSEFFRNTNNNEVMMGNLQFKHTSNRPQMQHLSMETILGVPVEILYRHINYNNGNNSSSNNDKPLLTRSEAKTFLKLQLLAQEMDVILQITEQVTQQQHQAKRFQALLERSKNPWLSPLLPLIKELTQSIEVGTPQTITKLEAEDESTQSPPGHSTKSSESTKPSLCYVSKTLLEVNTSMSELVEALQDCSVALWQSSEQNFALTDSLWDIVDDGDDNSNNDADGKKRSPTYILAKEKHALAKLQEHVAQRIDTVLQWQYKDSVVAASQPTKRTPTISFRTQLFGNSQSQQQGRIWSQRSTRSNNVEDENYGTLSTEELFTPLKDICDQLFSEASDDEIGKNGHNGTNQVETKEERQNDISLNDSKEGMAITGAFLYEASQNTASAANTMISLFHNSSSNYNKIANVLDPSVGNDDSRDSYSTTTTVNTRGKNTDTTFEYPSEQSPSRTTAGALVRKRRWNGGDEESQKITENSQFAKASAAMSLANMVSGRM